MIFGLASTALWVYECTGKNEALSAHADSQTALWWISTIWTMRTDMKSSQHQDVILSYKDLEGLGIKWKTYGHRGHLDKKRIQFIKDDKRMSRRRMKEQSDYDKQQELGQTQGHFTILGFRNTNRKIICINLIWWRLYQANVQYWNTL